MSNAVDPTGKPRRRKSRHAEIDANLRRVFEDIENEGLPERFESLLEELRTRDGAAGQSGGKTQ